MSKVSDKLLIIITALIVTAGIVIGMLPFDFGVNYGKDNNWYTYDIDKDDALIDVFCVSTDASDIMREQELYGADARLFVPQYRKSLLLGSDASDKQKAKAFEKASRDLKDAYEYYRNNCFDGRPVVMTGFGQGAELLKAFIGENGNDDFFKNNTVVVFMNGTQISEDEVLLYPNLRLAESEVDIGVILLCESSEEFYAAQEECLPARLEQFACISKIKQNNFGCTETSFEEMAEQDDYVGLARMVSPQMCESEYWVDKHENPDAIILNEAGINELNKEYEPTTVKPDYIGYYVGDCRKSILLGSEIKELVEVFEYPQEDLFHTDGTPVDEDFWNEMIELRHSEDIPVVRRVKYGVALDTADIRIAPTNEPLASSEDYDYCDELQNSSVRINEPLVIVWESSDDNWLFVVTRFCSGWIDASKVASTSDYKFWYTNVYPDRFLIVTDNYAHLDYDPSNEAIAGRTLTMGAKIKLLQRDDNYRNNYQRSGLHNYLVSIPCRKENGDLNYETAYLPQNIGVNVGYLDYTQRNLMELSFNSLGEQYGWGGQYGNRDCSQMVMEIYMCFGIYLPRNTSGMIKLPMTSVNVEGISSERKGELMNSLSAGSLLLFPGHVMVYLGEVNGEHYCISATGSMVNTEGEAVRRVRSVEINALEDTWRGNGKTWMDSITYIKAIY